MAFSGSSYFAGIGTAFAAIAVGFAGGAMITTNTVQPPNRLERVNAGPIAPSNAEATPASDAPSNAEQATKPPSQEAPASTVAATSSPPAANSQAPQPQTAARAAVKTDAGASNGQDQPAPASTTKTPPPSLAAKTEDTAPAKTDRAGTRSADANKETSRRRADDRRFSDRNRSSERRRRQDQDGRRLDEATNIAPQTPRNNAAEETVERYDTPRYRMRPRPFDLFGDDSPRVVNEPPPRFGFFGE
jgi:hypothetical protein